jgi:glycosyltransferase involved in cell wall biosynthesis
MADFSIIILSYNEEQHLPKLFNSLSELDAPLYVLDSGSTDDTLNICKQYGAYTAFNKFINHPLQWDTALKVFNIQTPWIIGLDSDQSLDSDLFNLLKNFKDSNYKDINGIYFNRKYLFKGTWIRHGGHYPFYQLKMFRKGIGYSDLNENMDHRFVISGKSVVWKQAHLIEENLKENAISFWIDKHNRYSDLIAVEEVERIKFLRSQTLKPDLFGNPDERRASMKRLWWKLPRYFRPFLYFTWRIIFQLGILDGKNGILYHYLHAFWFRLLVDVKIGELLKKDTNNESNAAKKEI